MANWEAGGPRGGGGTIAALSPSDAAAPPPCFVGSEAVKGCLRGVRLDFSTMLTGLCGSHSTGPADAVPSDILPADGPRLVIESVFSHHIAAALPAKRRRRKKKKKKAQMAFSRATVAVRGVS